MTANGPMAMIPYSVEINDIPIMLVQHHSADELLNRAKDQFYWLYQEEEQPTKVMAIAVYPYVSGVLFWTDSRANEG